MSYLNCELATKLTDELVICEVSGDVCEIEECNDCGTYKAESEVADG